MSSVIQQIANVAEVLTFDGYDYEKIGNVFIFQGTLDNEICIGAGYSTKDKQYSITIDTMNVIVNHKHHKVIDTAYISYLLRRVPGINKI